VNAPRRIVEIPFIADIYAKRDAGWQLFFEENIGCIPWSVAAHADFPRKYLGVESLNVVERRSVFQTEYVTW
jgi:hypothetical protein